MLSPHSTNYAMNPVLTHPQDKQDNCAAYYDIVASTLRAHFSVEASKDYFLSAAPSCSFPDVSIHPGYLAQSNFAWPHFFNDSKCGVGTPGFLDAVRDWYVFPSSF